MLQALPVLNCMHFMAPVSLADWRSYEVPGVVGILRKHSSGQYELVDAFDCQSVPVVRDLILNEKFSRWVEAAGGLENVRFDVFLMPQADVSRRTDVVTLIERSCGFRLPAAPAYVNAA